MYNYRYTLKTGLTMKEKLTESLEKYLLAAYEIVKTNKAARVKDVSNYLKIGMPATSDAIKTLAGRKYINYQPYGIITITSKGKKYSEEKIKRHKILRDFFVNILKIEEKTAEKDSSIMEYSVSSDVLEQFTKYLEFMGQCSCKEPKWIKSFQYYTEHGKMQTKCNKCIKNKTDFDNSKCCGCGE